MAEIKKNKLRKERERLNMTQNQLSEMAGISRRTLYALEQGDIDNARVSTLKKVAKVLNVSVGMLFFADE